MRILVVGNFPTTPLTGHQVKTARVYDEAIEILNTEDFDVIIMYAVIGTTNGRDFLLRIRSRRLPVLVIHEEDILDVTTDKPPFAVCPWNIPIYLQAYHPRTSDICRGKWWQVRKWLRKQSQAVMA